MINEDDELEASSLGRSGLDPKEYAAIMERAEKLEATEEEDVSSLAFDNEPEAV